MALRIKGLHLKPIAQGYLGHLSAELSSHKPMNDVAKRFGRSHAVKKTIQGQGLEPIAKAIVPPALPDMANAADQELML